MYAAGSLAGTAEGLKCSAGQCSVASCKADGVVLPSQNGAREPLKLGDQLDPLEGKLDGIMRQLKDISEKVWFL